MFDLVEVAVSIAIAMMILALAWKWVTSPGDPELFIMKDGTHCVVYDKKMQCEWRSDRVEKAEGR